MGLEISGSASQAYTSQQSRIAGKRSGRQTYDIAILVPVLHRTQGNQIGLLQCDRGCHPVSKTIDLWSRSGRTWLSFVHGESRIGFGMQCPFGLLLRRLCQRGLAPGAAGAVRLVRPAAEADSATTPGRCWRWEIVGPSHVELISYSGYYFQADRFLSSWRAITIRSVSVASRRSQRPCAALANCGAQARHRAGSAAIENERGAALGI